ncbi:MAG TPA: CHAP domain-containing protein [Candidatus Saccharimonadales bacterium]|nr:CHAP domain-containing protein [Candidatus Saccharimonadales bacterium]
MVRVKFLVFTLIIGSLLAGATIIGGVVRADSIDQQIQSLEQQNAAKQAKSDSLALTASNYQQAIDALSKQIDSLQDNIVKTQSQIDDLQKQIDKAQANLDQQKQVLGDNIRTMYLEGDISTLEILASSKNLSDFVNKQEYRNSVSDKVKASVDKINSLKDQLQKQQSEQKGLLNNLQNQQNQLQSQQDQKTSLLNYTEGQKAAYDKKIQSNNAEIASLRAQQAALNQQLGGVPVAGDPGHGGYPAVWNNAPQDSMLDSWDMYNRECVSYTAWKVYQTFGTNVQYGFGNANQWPGHARAKGIPTGSTPKVHSVAIWNVGAFGHAMWVEGVSGNTVYVSQYNYDYQGHYSEMSISASGLTFIYFGDKY